MHTQTHTHTRWICTQMYALLSHDMNMYPLTFRSEYTAIHADGTYCIATQAPSHAPSTAGDRCWQECCQEESSLISFYSLCILACLSLYTVWPCHRSCFFSLPVPLCTFFSFFLLLLLLLLLLFFFPLCYHHEIEVICAKRD